MINQQGVRGQYETVGLNGPSKLEGNYHVFISIRGTNRTVILEAYKNSKQVSKGMKKQSLIDQLVFRVNNVSFIFCNGEINMTSNEKIATQ